jgi:hypothetical protein
VVALEVACPIPDGGRAEVALPVAREHDRLAIDEGPVHRQAANRLGDGRESIGEVRPASAPDLHPLALLAGEDSEAVMLDLVQPAGSGGRAIGERRFARADEADRRMSSPTGRGAAPRRTRSNHQAGAAVASACSVVACAVLRARCRRAASRRCAAAAGCWGRRSAGSRRGTFHGSSAD